MTGNVRESRPYEYNCILAFLSTIEMSNFVVKKTKKLIYFGVFVVAISLTRVGVGRLLKSKI